MSHPGDKASDEVDFYLRDSTGTTMNLAYVRAALTFRFVEKERRRWVAAVALEKVFDCCRLWCSTVT
jgi:hypothetical protein